MTNRHVFAIVRGENHPKWKGGRRNVGAYVQVMCLDHPYANSRGYIYEHRFVMEQKLGRFLEPQEKVHHINRDGKDNRPENLQVVTDKEHIDIHLTGKKGHPNPHKGEKNPKIHR